MKQRIMTAIVAVSLMLTTGAAAWAQTIKMGVMLPLHDDNGDGRRMVEYYRGLLMGCDSLKKNGLNIDVHAWNLAEDGNVSAILNDPAAAQCDLIVGPLYSKQMPQLSDFVSKHDIKLLIPFSINAPQVETNANIFQVYQSPGEQNETIIRHFMEQFADCHPVFIDCNDSTSKKGVFTAALRQRMKEAGIEPSITNLKSPEESFQKLFSRSQPNVVILNTGRSPELKVAFAKLAGMVTTYPDVKVKVFGYTEWLMYTKAHLDNFYRFNVYIPSTFFYNPLTTLTSRVEQKYRWNFHQDMQQTALPRFAITGFDHALFFLQGLQQQGKQFTGAAGTTGFVPVQTPLHFERVGKGGASREQNGTRSSSVEAQPALGVANGGYKNRAMMFVHYMPEHRVETIKF